MPTTRIQAHHTSLSYEYWPYLRWVASNYEKSEVPKRAEMGLDEWQTAVYDDMFVSGQRKASRRDSEADIPTFRLGRRCYLWES